MKVLVTGGSGLVGQAVRRTCPQGTEAIYISSKDGDLTNYNTCNTIFEKCMPTHVIHLAAKVGGVLENSKFVGDFFYKNMQINLNVLECCKIHSVKNVISLLSTCIYPDSGNVLHPKDLHAGEPHSTSFGYAYAKRMLEVQSRAYNQQYGTKFSCLISNSIYGPNDNFHLESSHVVPAIIRKVYEAKLSNSKLTLWGSGTAMREFTYVDDIGCAIWWSLLSREDSCTINVGTDKDVSIQFLASEICKILDYDYSNIVWDDSKKSGQKERRSDTSRFHQESGIRCVSLNNGLKLTIDWFNRNYPNIRGISL